MVYISGSMGREATMLLKCLADILALKHSIVMAWIHCHFGSQLPPPSGFDAFDDDLHASGCN